MEYNLVVNGFETKVTLGEEKLTFSVSKFDGISTIISYQLDDVIGCEDAVKGWFQKTEITRVWLIEHGSSNVLLKKCKVISGDQRKHFQYDLTEMLTKETKRPKRVLVMINPIGGNGTARADFTNIVEPVFKLSGISMDIIFSEYTGHMIDVARTYDFTNTNGIVLLGGDGSYHEVVNVMMRKRQEEQGVDINDQNSVLSPLNIPIAMIPTGTGCGVTENNTGCKDVLTAALHVVIGRTVPSHLLALYSNDKLISFGGTASTYGFMTDLLFYSDRKFRWLGRSRYFIVPIWLFLFKSHTRRFFDAKVTYYTTVSERRNNDNKTEIFVGDRKLSGYSSYTAERVVFNRKLWNIMTLIGNVIFEGNVVFDVPRMFVPKPTACSSFIFCGTVSFGFVYKFFKYVVQRTPMEVLANEMEVLNVRGLNVELMDRLDDENPDMAMLSRLIQVDGEIYELEAPSFQLRYTLDVVQIFSSYL
ncbi:uncharacterized protein LOC125673096 [Ostrea edulis]|uniref:uncharacterized protein LOC125673096 n=1 Tax=Ostrea edulis TaxID=37623 RepID=UPI0024AEEF31|nr:uncharacterized protein LOC125673096 [Ostrea edulis]